MSKDMIVSLGNVIKVYKYGKQHIQALRGINLDVVRGEIVCIVDPSSSGKITLPNIIGELDKPDVGKVVDNVDIFSLRGKDVVEFRLKRVEHVF